MLTAPYYHNLSYMRSMCQRFLPTAIRLKCLRGWPAATMARYDFKKGHRLRQACNGYDRSGHFRIP